MAAAGPWPARSKKNVWRRLLAGVAAAALILCAPLAGATVPGPATRAEIDHLLYFLEHSECRFFRNGTWYTVVEARDHLGKKYDYLVKKGMITTAEDFIVKGASESSASGRPYQVQCGDSQPVPSARWLGDELARYRAQKRAAK